MFVAVALTSLVLAIVVNGECDSCQIPLKHYKELGCTPIVPDGACCASRYECNQMDNLVDDKCYYNGIAYDRGQQLTEDDMKGLCVAGCFCDRYSTPGKFTCANIECPEMFHRPEPGCVSQYTFDRCCAVRTVCDKAETDKLSTCEFEDRTYREGEKMFPKLETCYSCICAKNFDSSTIIGNPNCQEINCGVGLRSFGNIRAGCIPIYYGTSRCCPIGWKCPSENDQMTTNEGRSTADENDPNLVCKFGNLNMKLGDVLVSKNKCEECKCSVPPMAQCIQKPQC